MIENIRKYTGLMIVVFVIVFISFFFLDTSSMRSSPGSGTYVKIDGRGYSDKEVSRLGASGLNLTQSLAQLGDFGLYQFLMGLSSGARSENEAAEQFFVGRMILRDAAEKFGIHPADEEISSYIRSMRAFTNQDGAFDQTKYNTFIDKSLGRMGMTEGDVRDLASDVLISKKLNTLVGTGLAADRDIVTKTLALNNQQIDGNLAQIKLDPYEAKIEPTEDEIKTYWETIQDSFTTEPLRKFTYIIATPKLPEETAAEDETKETLAEAAASDEAKAAAQKAKDEERAKKAAALAEERRKKQIELDALVDDFVFDLENQQGSGFEELAKNNGWEVVTTELFAQSSPPPGLDIALRASSRGGKAAEELFRVKVLKSDPYSKISPAIAIGENQWLVARQDEEVPSRPKTYEEARDEARAQYIAEKAAEAMKTAAEEAATKIKEALAAGKSFADAAKDAGIEETHSLEKITTSHQPNAEKEPAGLFQAASNTDPGSLAENIIESDRIFILHVAKREVVKEENATARIDSELNNTVSQNETIAFMAWMAARTEAAKVEYPGRK